MELGIHGIVILMFLVASYCYEHCLIPGLPGFDGFRCVYFEHFEFLFWWDFIYGMV